MVTARTWALAVISGAASAGAAAALTPEEVWQSWQASGSAQGVAITAAGESRAGDALELTGVMLAVNQDGTRVEAPIGTVVMRDRGDGTVDIALPDSYSMTINVSEDGADVAMTISLAQPGLSTVASGSADAVRYQIDAPEVEFTLDSLVVDGETIPMGFAMAITGMAGVYGTSGSEHRMIDGDMRADAMAMSVTAENPDGEGSMAFDLASENFGVAFRGTMVPSMAGDDFGAMLREGFDVDGSYSAGATEYEFSFSEGMDSALSVGSFATGSVRFAMNASRMQYEASTTGLDVTVSGSEIPFPEVNVTLGEFAMGFLFPLATSAEPTDFSILARIVDLGVTDDIWGMFDPMGVLPRNPATLIVDAMGKVRLLMDASDPQFGMASEPPAELHAFDITELRLSAIGAEVTGSGAFTFDNTDLQTFDGLPRPLGAVDLRIVGANTLIDKLVAMGMLPDDQAMGARMMLGLFARPADGEDTLTSKIEVTPEGAVLANGQRIQ